MDETPPPITNVKQFTAAMLESARTLSPSTEAWSQAALDAGNRADHDPEYVEDVGKRLFLAKAHRLPVGVIDNDAGCWHILQHEGRPAYS